MKRLRAPLLLALLACSGACAEGQFDGFEEDAAYGGDAALEDIPSGDDVATAPEDAFVLPPEDVVGTPKDSGVSEPDIPATFEDVAAPPVDLGSPGEDAFTPVDAFTPRDVVTPRDAVTVDTGPRDAGGGCAAGQTLCAGRCVSTQTDPANCGACGMTCPSATPACSAGRCAAPGCGSGASDCDGNAANGCETAHMSMDSCAAAPNLGTWCGDVACGFLCPSTSSRVVATRSGRASAWFRGRTNECSNCPARLEVTFTLTVPAGVDYDLFVYDACGGTPIGRSQNLAGQTDRVTITRSGDLGSDSFNWWVEVRYFSGGSCTPWSLTVQTRSASASSC